MLPSLCKSASGMICRTYKRLCCLIVEERKVELQLAKKEEEHICDDEDEDNYLET